GRRERGGVGADLIKDINRVPAGPPKGYKRDSLLEFKGLGLLMTRGNAPADSPFQTLTPEPLPGARPKPAEKPAAETQPQTQPAAQPEAPTKRKSLDDTPQPTPPPAPSPAKPEPPPVIAPPRNTGAQALILHYNT